MSCKNVYDIVDREAQNEQFFVERNQRLEAGAVAARLRGEELTDMALALGFDPNTMTKSDLTRKVVEFAESSERDRKTGKTGSQMFLDIWKSPSRVELTTFKRALSTGVITFDAGSNEYRYQNLPIGHSEEEVVSYLKRKPIEFTSIDMQSKRIDSEGTKMEDYATAPGSIQSEKDAEIARQAERIARLEAQLKETSALATGIHAEQVVSDADPEYAQLLKEANKLFKGAHQIGRGQSIEKKKELLKQKIEDHNQSKSN